MWSSAEGASRHLSDSFTVDPDASIRVNADVAGAPGQHVGRITFDPLRHVWAVDVPAFVHLVPGVLESLENRSRLVLGRNWVTCRKPGDGDGEVGTIAAHYDIGRHIAEITVRRLLDGESANGPRRERTGEEVNRSALDDLDSLIAHLGPPWVGTVVTVPP